MKGQNPANIAVLSIGTGSVALPSPQQGQPVSPYVQEIVEPGFVTDLRKLASILTDPPDLATFLAHVMTASGIGLNQPASDSRVVRMNPLISPVKKAGAWSVPGCITAAQFKYLVELDIDAVEQPQVEAISHYADRWVQDLAPNQPIRMNGDTLEPELGQPTFGSAAAAWNAIK